MSNVMIKKTDVTKAIKKIAGTGKIVNKTFDVEIGRTEIFQGEKIFFADLNINVWYRDKFGNHDFDSEQLVSFDSELDMDDEKYITDGKFDSDKWLKYHEKLLNDEMKRLEK